MTAEKILERFRGTSVRFRCTPACFGSLSVRFRYASVHFCALLVHFGILSVHFRCIFGALERLSCILVSFRMLP